MEVSTASATDAIGGAEEPKGEKTEKQKAEGVWKSVNTGPPSSPKISQCTDQRCSEIDEIAANVPSNGARKSTDSQQTPTVGV